MKEPIEVGDIRKGDLIRAEYRDGCAVERWAESDGDERGSIGGFHATHFLLKRPAPSPRVLMIPGAALDELRRISWPADSPVIRFIAAVDASKP